MSSCEHKTVMLEVGELCYPVLPYEIELLLPPLVGIVEMIFVGDVGIFANKSQNLSFGSKGVVANCHRRFCLLYLHFLGLFGKVRIKYF